MDIQNNMLSPLNALSEKNDPDKGANLVGLNGGLLGDKVLELDAAKVKVQQGKNQAGNVDDAINVIHGHSKNYIVSDTHSCVIAGGGMLNKENVIGGNVANVNTGSTNINPVEVLGTQSQFCMIGGGYDNVVNGLANVIPVGMHCYIDVPADHGTICGGSVHKIQDGSYNAIYGGSRNTVGVNSGGYSMIAGGSDNEITGSGSHVFVGGSFCTSTDSGFSVISGGQQNDIINSNFATISGGSGNNIELDNSTIAGGNGNDVSGTGQGVSIGGGINNHAHGECSTVAGGRDNEANANYTQASGYRAKAERAGQHAFANGYFATKADAQHSRIILKKQTTTATPTNLEDLSGGANFPTKTNIAIAYKITVVGHRTDVQLENVMIVLEGMAHRGSSGTHRLVKFDDKIIGELNGGGGVPPWAAEVYDNAGQLRVRVTGENSKNINWVALVEFTECAG